MRLLLTGDQECEQAVSTDCEDCGMAIILRNGSPSSAIDEGRSEVSRINGGGQEYTRYLTR